MKNLPNRLTTALLIVYVAVLCWILVLKLGVRFSYMKNRSVNLIPFSDTLVLNQLILNALIFVPLGLYTAILFKKWSLGRQTLFVCLVSSIIEGLQYALAIGAFDITDIITNTLGGVIGFVTFKALEHLLKSHSKAQKWVNIVATTATVGIIVLLVMLKMSMLPVRYQ